MLFDVLLIAAVGFAPPADLKCPQTHALPGFPDDGPVVMIDGKVRAGPDFDVNELDPADIESIEIRCWNPDTDELPASSGIPLVLVTTTGLRAATEDEVRGVAIVLREFALEHDRMPTSVGELDLEPSAGLEISRLGDGWHVATAGTRALHCTAHVNDEGDPSVGCRASYDLARSNLREAYRGRVDGIG